MEFVSYRKYKTKEETLFLKDLLISNQIEYYVEDISPAFDITFTGGTELEDKFVIKIKASDFKKVDELLGEIARQNSELLDKNHYLFDFSDDELFEILENYNEWSEADYQSARKILAERGEKISNQKLQELKDIKNAKLRKPEKGHKVWLIFGYISAILGGWLGIFIGYYHFNFKKTIPTGEKIYVFDVKTRKTGLRIFYTGIISFPIWIFLWIFDFI